MSPSSCRPTTGVSSSSPSAEGGVAWNDPTLGIRWPLPAEDIVLSAKDAERPALDDCGELFDYRIDYYA